MVKRFTLLAMLALVLSLSLPVTAADPGGTGIINCQVVNKTPGTTSSVANLEVKLVSRQANSTPLSATTDSNGRFVFKDLATGPEAGYQLAVNYQDASYASELVQFSTNETTQTVELVVYDSTTSTDSISVDTSHAVMYAANGTLQVKEYFSFVNESGRTYIGVKTADGRRQTLQFSLPAQAKGLQLMSGLILGHTIVTAEGFADTLPVMPGSREILFTYSVPYSGGTYSYSQKLFYPVAKFNLLVQGQDITIAGDRLVGQPPLNMNGWYSYAVGQNLAAGDRLTANLSGLPSASGRSGYLIWLILGLALLAGSAVGIFYLRRAKPETQPEPTVTSPDTDANQETAVISHELEVREDSVIAEIARLDDDFESGKLSESAYKKQRAARKAELVKLMSVSKKR